MIDVPQEVKDQYQRDHAIVGEFLAWAVQVQVAGKFSIAEVCFLYSDWLGMKYLGVPIPEHWDLDRRNDE